MKLLQQAIRIQQQATLTRICFALEEAGYDGSEDFEAYADPQVPNVYALRVGVGRNDAYDLLLRSNGEVEEVEFTAWPPVATLYE